MMPAMRPCSSTTASVIRLYLSKSAATSSCGVSGAHATYGSPHSEGGTARDDTAIFTSGANPASLWPGAGRENLARASRARPQGLYRPHGPSLEPRFVYSHKIVG